MSLQNDTTSFDNEIYYYNLKSMSDILLTSVNKIEEAFNNRELWEHKYLIYLDNPIVVDGEKRYYQNIMAMLDKLINIPDQSTYKENYQKEISNIYFIGDERIDISELEEDGITENDFIMFVESYINTNNK